MSATDPLYQGRVGIAGAGLLGRLLAWKLVKQGCEVTLFDASKLFDQDRIPSLTAAYTAAGMIAPLSEAVATEKLIFDLGRESLALWPRWLAALTAETGQTINYEHNGSLVIAHPQDHAELVQFQCDLNRTLGAQAQAEQLDRAGVHSLEPDLADHFHNGLLLPEEAHIDNYHLMDLLLQRCLQLGVQVHDESKVNVDTRRIYSDNAEHHFDLVLDCRGAGAKAQWPQVRGVRGEVLTVQTRDVQLSRPVRLMHPRYQLYVVPKPDNFFVIGATQIESEDRSPMTVQSIMELSSALYTISPAFAEARISDLSVNLRPSLTDNRPRIEATDGLIKINGLFRHGYLLAPVVIETLLQWLNGGDALAFSSTLGLEERSLA